MPAFAQVLSPTGSGDKPLAAFFRETWTTREGLPHNQVNAIAQTPDGYLWLGTWEGLVRYNGLEFHVFDRRNTPALLDNGIRSLRASEDGAVVIGTSRGGVTVKRGDAWRTWLVEDGLAQEEVMDALLDRKGRLWVAFESAGLDRVEGDKVVHFNQGNGLPSDVIYGLMLDRDGSVWVASAGGLTHFGNDGRMVNYGVADGLPDAPVYRVMRTVRGELLVGTESGAYRQSGKRFGLLSSLLPVDGVPSLAEDAAGNLWVGSVNNGLLRLAKSGVERFTSLRGLPNNRVASLLVDREGSIWAGTNAGLLRLSDAPFSTFNGDQGLSDDYVRSMFETRDGALWVGTSRGLNRVRNGRLEASYTSADGLASDSILSLLEDADGSLLMGTYTAGVMRLRDGRIVDRYDNAHGMPGSNQVRALARQADGTLWFGTNRGLVRLRDGEYRRFGMDDGLPREFIISLHVAADGSVWVGTANGAARIMGEQVQAVDLRDMNGAQDVFDFHEDADGAMWMATDRGLLRWRNGQLRAIGLKQGLPVDTLFQVVDDGLGSLWLTSNRGVMRVRRADAEAVLDGRIATLSMDLFGEADGLASSQCNGGSGPAALRDSRGKVWVATARGASVVNPAALRDFRRRLPPVVVEQVLANDVPVATSGLLQLPAGTRKLEFHYASLSFLLPRFVHYRYRLEGMDADWIERGNQRVAQYTNLKPGHYRFLVSAAAPTLGEQWGEDSTVLELEIAPLLWQQPWFLPLVAGLGLLALYALYLWRSAQLRQRATELEGLVARRTQQLQEQSEAFERQAREDWLTGLPNRRAMEERLAQAFAEAIRGEKPLSFALFDVDHFKRLNDDFSHAAGDAALREVAMALQREAGAQGVVARWGGEEFAVVFPGLPLAQARDICERLRRAVAELDCAGFAPEWRLTVSAGVAERTGLVHHGRLVSRADGLLYEAKRAGRNRVVG